MEVEVQVNMCFIDDNNVRYVICYQEKNIVYLLHCDRLRHFIYTKIIYQKLLKIVESSTEILAQFQLQTYLSYKY